MSKHNVLLLNVFSLNTNILHTNNGCVHNTPFTPPFIYNFKQSNDLGMYFIHVCLKSYRSVSRKQMWMTKQWNWPKYTHTFIAHSAYAWQCDIIARESELLSAHTLDHNKIVDIVIVDLISDFIQPSLKAMFVINDDNLSWFPVHTYFTIYSITNCMKRSTILWLTQFLRRRMGEWFGFNKVFVALQVLGIYVPFSSPSEMTFELNVSGTSHKYTCNNFSVALKDEQNMAEKRTGMNTVNITYHSGVTSVAWNLR